jgi:hypothetical protein
VQILAPINLLIINFKMKGEIMNRLKIIVSSLIIAFALTACGARTWSVVCEIKEITNTYVETTEDIRLYFSTFKFKDENIIEKFIGENLKQGDVICFSFSCDGWFCNDIVTDYKILNQK